MFELLRFTDHAHRVVKYGFRGQLISTEQAILEAMENRTRGVGCYLLRATDVSAGNLGATRIPVERLSFVNRAREIAWKRGVNYVGSEHLVIALASLPGSELAAKGVTAEKLESVLSAAESKWKNARPPLARRMGRWCRFVLRAFGLAHK